LRVEEPRCFSVGGFGGVAICFRAALCRELFARFAGAVPLELFPAVVLFRFAIH
jgi:hypothetical protein